MRSLLRALPFTLACVALPLLGCDSANVCEQAVTKINRCLGARAAADAGADGSTSEDAPLQLLKFAGDCNDAVLLGAGEAVPFKSWAEQYVPCEIDSATCLCPNLPWYDEFAGPDVVGGPTPL